MQYLPCLSVTAGMEWQSLLRWRISWATYIVYNQHLWLCTILKHIFCCKTTYISKIFKLYETIYSLERHFTNRVKNKEKFDNAKDMLGSTPIYTYWYNTSMAHFFDIFVHIEQILTQLYFTKVSAKSPQTNQTFLKCYRLKLSISNEWFTADIFQFIWGNQLLSFRNLSFRKQNCKKIVVYWNTNSR